MLKFSDKKVCYAPCGPLVCERKISPVPQKLPKKRGHTRGGGGYTIS